MRAPYRVIVWGPGGLGAVCIREVAQKKEFELVGVFAYSESKRGCDAGELVGLPPLGVSVVTSREEALAIDCDCVIYLARDFGNYHYTDEILQILSAGKNLISVLPIQNLDHLGASCDPDFPSKSTPNPWRVVSASVSTAPRSSKRSSPHRATPRPTSCRSTPGPLASSRIVTRVTSTHWAPSRSRSSK